MIATVKKVYHIPNTRMGADEAKAWQRKQLEDAGYKVKSVKVEDMDVEMRQKKHWHLNTQAQNDAVDDRIKTEMSKTFHNYKLTVVFTMPAEDE